MLSDEMTTGSITSSESHKRAFAARSHSWNVTQLRFKEAFPEVSDSSMFLYPSVPGCFPVFDPLGLIVNTMPSFLNLIDMSNESNTNVEFIALLANITGLT